jgi:proteic killer suppression protein
MIVTFEKEYLRDLYHQGKSKEKKYRFQPEVIRKFKVRIDTLIGASKIEDLYLLHSLNYEALQGEKKGISSIRINNQYRIEFKVKYEGQEPTVTICHILELSNHYK